MPPYPPARASCDGLEPLGLQLDQRLCSGLNSLVGWAYLAFRSLAQLLCRSIHLAEGFMDLDSHNWVINYCFKIYVFGLFLLGNSCQNLEASSLPRFINLNFSRRLMSHWTTPHSFGCNKSDLSWRKNHHVFPKGCFIQVNDSHMHIFSTIL